jgi:NAD(P)-dependent dehydrogenase (short-subunit alcohol dehydrogenase family)
MKIALITGANKGIGFATARRLGEAGAKVIIGARDASKAEQAMRALREDGLDAESVTLDVADRSSVAAAAEALGRRHRRLDILVNNAGVLPEVTQAERVNGPLDLDMFRATFETNVFGAVAVTNAFLPLLGVAEAARIVNVSSRMGSLADQSNPESPYYGVVVPAYQTSKAALNSITIALSKSLAGTPIKVNAVCPGWVKTDLGGPQNKADAPLTADEAARVAVSMALLGDDGPTGTFVDAEGTVDW